MLLDELTFRSGQSGTQTRLGRLNINYSRRVVEHLRKFMAYSEQQVDLEQEMASRLVYTGTPPIHPSPGTLHL